MASKQVRDHIRPYVAKPEFVSVRGFVVAGGDGGGYAFGGQEFYLNITLNDDIVMAKQVMIHEAFHSAIVEQEGPAAVGQIIQQPGYEFVLRYT